MRELTENEKKAFDIVNGLYDYQVYRLIENLILNDETEFVEKYIIYNYR